mmetsp:Transcript_21148/g.47635  ORF Transcript_21148/g.47635 Transcript_21148/m.47635 type:complete len:90 (-) Transcript_21148:79-348(-)
MCHVHGCTCLEELIFSSFTVLLHVSLLDLKNILLVSKRGKTECIKMLLEAKADLEIVDRSGRKAIDVAFNEECRNLLLPPPENEEEAEE